MRSPCCAKLVRSCERWCEGKQRAGVRARIVDPALSSSATSVLASERRLSHVARASAPKQCSHNILKFAFYVSMPTVVGDQTPRSSCSRDLSFCQTRELLDSFEHGSCYANDLASGSPCL